MSMDPPYRIVRVSPEWCISSLTRPNDCEAIQFITSIERDGSVLILSYGANDLEARVLTVRLEDVMSMLKTLNVGEHVLKAGKA
jgi:hypothetical protein